MDNYQYVDHVIAFLLLIARIGDIGSTYLVTPRLKLEANPIVRRLGWPFALLTILICLAPYWSVPGGIILLVVSLLVSASNSSKIWFIRTMGEEEYYQLVLNLTARAKLGSSLLFLLLPAFFMGLLGGTVIFLYPDPNYFWGYYFGEGVLVYAAVIAIYSPLTFLRLRRKNRAREQTRSIGT